MADHTTVAELIEGLRSGPPAVQAGCSRELGDVRLADEEAKVAVSELLGGLTHRDKAVRTRSAVSLGWKALEWSRGGAPDAVRALAAALDNPAPLMRTYAAWALGQIGAAARDVVERVEGCALHDEREEVRDAARHALARISREP
jgi:HEAT repeat protein